MKKILIMLCTFISAFSLADIAEEPQTLNPFLDKKLIQSFQLDNSVQNWKESVVNILLVGQDGQMPLPFPYINRENGDQIRRLSSRADATVLLSFNKDTGQTTLFSLQRDNVDISDQNEILTHQYILKGRRYYLNLVKNRIEKTVRQLHQEKLFFAPDQKLHIHGMVELDFQTFTNLLTHLHSDLLSTAQLAWGLRAHSVELLNLLNPDNDALKKLRARKNYLSGSYQRSLNHALFISSVLGILSYTMVDSNEKNFLDLSVLQEIFSTLSRTFALGELVQNLKMRDQKTSVLEKNGFHQGVSQVDIYLLGVDTESYALYKSGKLFVNISDRGLQANDRLLRNLDVQLGQFLKVKDCDLCR